MSHLCPKCQRAVYSSNTAEWDVTLLYACTGGGDLLQACLGLKPDNLIFVRHRSGPVYYWYEALSTRYLAADSPQASDAQNKVSPAHVDDVVVDDYEELVWRLRALRGVRNFIGSRIVALGGSWGKYAPDAPAKAQERFGLQVATVDYEDFGPRIRRALADPQEMAMAEQWTRRYLALPHTRLRTERNFVVNAFVLYRVLRQLMEEHNAAAITIKSCMGTRLSTRSSSPDSLHMDC